MSLESPSSTTISTANLIISTTALVTTITTLFPQAPYPCLLTLFRILHTLLLLSPIIPSLTTLFTLITNPTSTIAPPTPLYPILDTVAARYNATVGITRQALTPTLSDPQITPIIHVFVLLIALFSAFVLVAKRHRIRRDSAVIAFVISTLYVLASLLTAFTPRNLPLDSSLLQVSWLDQTYTDLDLVNETRLLQNFWMKLDDGGHARLRVAWLPRVDGFAERFCDQFNALGIDDGLVVDEEDGDDGADGAGTAPPSSTSTSTSTTAVSSTEEDEQTTQNPTRPPPSADEDNRPQPRNTSALLPTRLTRTQLSDILIVYTIGKPLHTTLGKSISLLSLPFLTLSPIFISHAIHSRVLHPFILAALATLLVLIIYATPETLRPIRAPFEASDLITFCARGYRVFVTDRVTHRVAVFDVVSFAFVGVTAILQGFRWLRKEKIDDHVQVKMVAYHDVFSRSGSLRW